MNKFKGKYRIASTRWVPWDYGSNAAYFVTICTQGRAHDFGQIANQEMILSPVGQAAWDCWLQIPDHFPFVQLGAFVVMPDHVHGIIIIDKSDVDDGAVETQHVASLHPPPGHPPQPKNTFGPQSKNLASIVRGYKIGVTKFARQNAISFGWQARYHDHVIRDADEYDRIEGYIRTNPENWQSDSLFGE